MNYRKEFESCFAYIEAHIKEEITTDELARVMGYSLYHFCRIFYAYQGMAPMEYVLERRLQAALLELIQGRKIIDIACDYGFETPNGFSKAFRKKYEKSPSQMRSYVYQVQDDRLAKEYKNVPTRVTIKELGAFYISGYRASLDFAMSSYQSNMVAFWDKFEQKNIEERLYTELNPNKHAEIGISIRDEVDLSTHSYLLGVIAYNDHNSLPWSNYEIVGGKYAIFTTTPIDMTESEYDFAEKIRETWKYIFTTWFETAQYEYDDSREAFEYYDERCHYREDSVMDIYIPIQ